MSFQSKLKKFIYLIYERFIAILKKIILEIDLKILSSISYQVWVSNFPITLLTSLKFCQGFLLKNSIGK